VLLIETIDVYKQLQLLEFVNTLFMESLSKCYCLKSSIFGSVNVTTVLLSIITTINICLEFESVYNY